MKVWAKTASAVMLAGTVFVGGFGGLGLGADSGRAYAAEAVNVVRNVISVNGVGEISVSPDIAYLSIGVQTQGKTAVAAQKENAQAMDKVNKLLKATWGINEKDIQTVQFSVQPNYSYSEEGGQQLKGYTAYHTLSVAYRDLSKIGQLLDAAAGAGANSIDNVRFTVENPEKYEEEVIAKALANAQMKANAVAKAANRQLGSLLNVSLENAQPPVFYQEVAVSKAADSTGANTAVEPGQITVDTRLSAQYEMN
ncbi:SIMPL domain-containing protein [Paenibacillus sp. P96]|uniref:SIMPL domain-containing protein n=1 Tax=Paenibacillus zeirhizosphaerae TaxID=2987519 RepID=A0ABT9FXL2_9BACL|nr:SIMPL domain-containing protein [Paenibacillus sp. P96]MDP4099472.1 SIMPL domain-containing protein [Paenibacillus sp. P96]